MRKKKEKSGFLSLYRTVIGIDFDNLLAHCEFAKASIKDEGIRFAKSIEKAAEGLDEQRKSSLYEWHEDEAWRIYDVFPSLQWMSSFLLAYGLFERTLNEICRRANPHSCEIALLISAICQQRRIP